MSVRISYEALFRWTEAVFLQIGCPADQARQAAHSLLVADQRGIDSHGVARLSGYVRLREAGRINPAPDIRLIHEAPGTGVVDGDAGLGLVVGPYAMSLAMEKAERCGTGWIAVQNSNHFGIAGHYAMMALNYDMIGVAMTNASALVAPTFSRERMLGTNPVSVAVPAGNEPPFVADFATTTAANGKLEILQRTDAPAPLGWIQDQDGEPTRDASILKKGGSLLPLGSDREHSSHKGYMMGSIVDILCGVLSGANYGPWVPPFPAYVPMPEGQPGKGIGHFFGAMRIDAFRPATAFKQDMDQWIRRFRQARPIHPDQPVLIPGDPEREAESRCSREGIPLSEPVHQDLIRLGDHLGCAFPVM